MTNQMKYFKEHWALFLLGFLFFTAMILGLIYQHNESKLEYSPGQTYYFTLSNVNLDLLGDNITVTYHHNGVKFIREERKNENY